jgi:type VI secretion system protein ImpH
MASSDRRKAVSVIAELFAKPQQFDFFQAVRIIEQWSKQQVAASYDSNPENQAKPLEHGLIRFKTSASLAFPSVAIQHIKAVEDCWAEISVYFMGLTGTQGTLPQHYTEFILKQNHLNDRVFKECLDLFNHRSLMLYYQAWKKYRLAAQYGQARVNQEDTFTYTLRCLVGLGTGHLKNRTVIPDQVLFYYAGFFSQQTRSMAGLRAILSDYFDFTVQIKPWQGKWFNIAKSEQTWLPGLLQPKGQYNQLGKTAILGTQVFQPQGKFRLVIGPLSLNQFQNLLPNGKTLPAVLELTELYVGYELEFDVQLCLEPAEIPTCQLSSVASYQPLLGWNTWLPSLSGNYASQAVVLNNYQKKGWGHANS